MCSNGGDCYPFAVWCGLEFGNPGRWPEFESQPSTSYLSEPGHPPVPQFPHLSSAAGSDFYLVGLLCGFNELTRVQRLEWCLAQTQ